MAGLATSDPQASHQSLAQEQAELEQVLSSLETQVPGVEPLSKPLSNRERLILALGMQLSQSELTEALKLHSVKQLVASLEPNLDAGKLPMSEEDSDETGR